MTDCFIMIHVIIFFVGVTNMPSGRPYESWCAWRPCGGWLLGSQRSALSGGEAHGQGCLGGGLCSQVAVSGAPELRGTLLSVWRRRCRSRARGVRVVPGLAPAATAAPAVWQGPAGRSRQRGRAERGSFPQHAPGAVVS